MALMDSPDFDKAVAEIYRFTEEKRRFLFQRLAPVLHDRGFGWVTDRQSNQEKLTVSGYYSKTQRVEHCNFSGSGRNKKTSRAICHPGISRTLAEYINPLVSTGLS